jgi:penicillin-binding protein 1C
MIHPPHETHLSSRDVWRETFFVLAAAIVSWALIFWLTKGSYEKILQVYAQQESVTISDRNGREILIKPNARGFYARFVDRAPASFAAELVQSEDRYFYYHPGINPFSIARALIERVFTGKYGGSSTITQQLAKILLGNETDRNFKNKLNELFLAFCVELHSSKPQILAMYSNAAYFGNQAQGIEEASRYYYNVPASGLTRSQAGELAGVLKSPSSFHPVAEEQNGYSRQAANAFELKSFGIDCQRSCAISADAGLTESLRAILNRTIRGTSLKGVSNGAVVALKLPENELLAVIGSPDPSLDADGYKINMASRSRAIGSTVKPLIYAQAFEKGLRPYTLVDDREYSYAIGTGFQLYPKNFDYQYHGEVSLHYALSNSLNVPSVKVLEYVGPEAFYGFLTDELGFKPLQPLENYELGIALGELDMDLATLADYFSIFPNNGMLKPIVVGDDDGVMALPMADARQERQVIKPEFTELINKILSDRTTGVEQFGIKSSLNLPYSNYAVKTGTSREFHDSWTVGYTPDFLVASWLGNADDTAMDQVSGSIGAGRVWHDAMELLYASQYNRNSQFDFSRIKEFNDASGIDYGIEGDDYVEKRDVLKNADASIILEPHDGDIILLQGAEIPLRANERVSWFVNGSLAADGNETFFKPKAAGSYIIKAQTISGKSQAIRVEIRAEEE